MEAPYAQAGSAVHAARDDHSEHASFSANYRFRCDNLGQLDSVHVALFASFPGVHEIKMQWLTPGKQGAAKLTAQHNQLQLK